MTLGDVCVERANNPMRVLQVVGAMDRAGAETMIMNLYRAVDRSRIQFDFLVHENRKCDYDEEIESMGGRLFRISRFNGLNALSYARDAGRIIDAHPEWSIIHGHIGSSAAIYLREAKARGRATVAHSHAQHYPLSVSEVAFRAVSYPTRYIADEFIGCSEAAGRDRFGTTVVKGPHFHLLRNGVPVDAYACCEADHRRAKHALGLGEELLVGHVGRLSAVKNHDFLFKVFGEILKERPSAKLMLVGRGEREGELRRIVRANGLESAVIFYGITGDVPSVMKAFDVFVFPSLKEGLPLAAIEAQAAGVPVFLSDGVSSEAVASSLAHRLPLDVGSAAWAREVLTALDEKQINRSEGADQVRSAGFDIAETAGWLTQFYLNLAGNESL